jgi:hypothetical protein
VKELFDGKNNVRHFCVGAHSTHAKGATKSDTIFSREHVDWQSNRRWWSRRDLLKSTIERRQSNSVFSVIDDTQFVVLLLQWLLFFGCVSKEKKEFTLSKKYKDSLFPFLQVCNDCVFFLSACQPFVIDLHLYCFAIFIDIRISDDSYSFTVLAASFK